MKNYNIFPNKTIIPRRNLKFFVKFRRPIAKIEGGKDIFLKNILQIQKSFVTFAAL